MLFSVLINALSPKTAVARNDARSEWHEGQSDQGKFNPLIISSAGEDPCNAYI